jgi:ElaB/YqjD/DUF883 family membrane-anchored ribosome-binding protein
MANISNFPASAAQFGKEVKSKAQEAGTSVAEKAKDAAYAVADKAKDAACSVGHTAEGATAAVGGGMQSLAGTIRDKGPSDGMIGKATSAVADTLESGGRYLQEEGLSGIAQDITNLIRRNPFPAILIGIGVGYLLARATTRS